MKAYYEKLNWEKGQVQLLRKSAVGYIPSNAIEGSNDTLIVPLSAKLNFTVVTENDQYITSNIIDTVKAANGWAKMSKKRYDKLNEKLINTPEYNVDLSGNIQGLDEIVQV